MDRLLHELRSTLARLKAEVELLTNAGDLRLPGPFESLTEAFDLIAALESSRERGQRLILVLDDDPRLAQYQPYWAARAALLARAGDAAGAAEAYQRAIGLESDPALRAFLQNELLHVA